jgi:hypothetical protein
VSGKDGINTIFESFISGATIKFWYLFPLIILLLVFIHPKILGYVLNFGLKLLRRKKIKIKISYFQILMLILLYCIYWVIIGTSFYLMINAIVALKIQFLLVVSGMFAVSWALGFLSFFTPGGIGVREGILTLLLSLLFPTGIAIVITIIWRIQITLVEIVLGMIGIKSLK